MIVCFHVTKIKSARWIIWRPSEKCHQGELVSFVRNTYLIEIMLVNLMHLILTKVDPAIVLILYNRLRRISKFIMMKNIFGDNTNKCSEMES